MKKAYLCVAAGAALAALTGSAETVARALVKIAGSGNSQLFVYNISDTGEWTQNKVFCNQRSSYGIRRAQCVNGIVYVMEAASGASGVGGYIYRYRADGTFIDQYLSFDGSADGMVVTPDAHYLFVANNEDNTYKGRLMRYDMVKNEWKVDYGFSSSAFMRQMCTDDAGHLYVANRNSPRVYKFDIEHEGEKYTDSNYEARSESLDLVGAVCWDPATDRVYSGGRTTIRSCDSDLKTLAQATVPTAFEWFYASAVINGKVYFGSYQTPALYLVDPDDCSTTKVTVDGATDKYKYDHIADFPILEKSRWAFDDAAGVAVGAEKVYLQGGARFGATGVRGNSLCLGSETARAELGGTQELLGKTGDFAVSFNVLLPAKDDATDARVLFSNDIGQGGALSVFAATDNTLGLSYRATSGGIPVELTTDAVVADGTWHHIGLVRKAETSLALLMDGENVGTATLTAGDPISRAVNWHLGSKASEDGGFAGAGAFFDELRVFEPSNMPLASDWLRLSGERTGAAMPTVPSAPTREAAALDPAFGTEITHAFADDAPLGAPNLFKAKDGTWYVAVDRNNAKTAVGQKTEIWKSTDNCTTWTKFDEIAASSVSLFHLPNSTALSAIGMEGYRRCVVWTCDESKDAGERWTEVAAYAATEDIEIAPGPVTYDFGRISRPVAFRDDVFTPTPRFGFLRFAYASGAFGTIDLTVGNNCFHQSTYAVYSTIRKVRPASTVFAPNGDAVAYDSVAFLVPIEHGVPDGANYIAGVESCLYASMYDWYGDGGACRQNGRVSGLTFPGAAHEFAMFHDATTARYYALTTPGKRNRLALYSSEDLRAWRPCGTVAESEEGAVGYVAPAVVVDGDDLVVAYGVACADGAGGPRSTDGANYIAVRRIANFRTAYVPEKPDWKRMIVVDAAGTMLQSYWRSASGEWLSDKLLVASAGTLGGEKFEGPRIVSVSGRDIYVACGVRDTIVKIFKFSRRGGFRRVYVAPDGVKGPEVAMAVSPDGATLYVSASSSDATKVWKVDTASGTWSEFVTDATRLATVNHLAVGPDGDVYTANYGSAEGSNGNVNRWKADGTFVGRVCSVGINATGMAIDEAGEYIYCAGVRGSIDKVELATGTKTRFSDYYNGSVTPAYELSCFEGKLYVSATYGWVYAYDLETGKIVEPVGAMYSAHGIAVRDLDVDGGMLLLVR